MPICLDTLYTFTQQATRIYRESPQGGSVASTLLLLNQHNLQHFEYIKLIWLVFLAQWQQTHPEHSVFVQPTGLFSHQRTQLLLNNLWRQTKLIGNDACTLPGRRPPYFFLIIFNIRKKYCASVKSIASQHQQKSQTITFLKYLNKGLHYKNNIDCSSNSFFMNNIKMLFNFRSVDIILDIDRWFPYSYDLCVNM